MSSAVCNYVLALPQMTKAQFLLENTIPVISSSVSEMKSIGSGGSLCIVCVAKSLEKNSAVFHNPQKLTVILNKALGTTWNKPSKQKRHCETLESLDHSSSFFCNNKPSILKNLVMWKHGVLAIGGLYCTAPGLWTGDRLKSWVVGCEKNHSIE